MRNQDQDPNIPEDVGATAFDMPNNMNPRPHFKAYYGNQYVPRRTNEAAKHTNASEVMNEVNHAKR